MVLCLYLPYIFKYNPDLIHRLIISPNPAVLWLPDLGQHSLVFFFWAALILILLRMYNLYTTDRTISYLDESVLTGKALLLALLPAAAAVFFLQIKIFSREVFILQTASLFITLIGWRIFKRYLVRRRVARGFNNQHVLIVGAGKVGLALAGEIARNRYLGLEVIGFLDDTLTGEKGGYPILGRSDNFEEVVRKKFVDEVLVSIPSERDLVARLIMACRKLGKNIRVVPDLMSMGMEGVKSGYLGRIPLLEYYNRGLHGADLLLKRSFDVVASTLALIILAPVMLGIGLAIKIDSPGPVIYASKRNGKKGILFNFFDNSFIFWLKIICIYSL